MGGSKIRKSCPILENNKSLGYHSTTVFSSGAPPTPTGKASKAAQIWVKISFFWPKNRAFHPNCTKNCIIRDLFVNFSFLVASLNAEVVFNSKPAA